jgi:hypothetical protein
MGPLINQLLEEAIQRSTDLAERADALAEEAGDIQETAGVFGRLAEHEADGLHREMLEALHALEQARQGVDTQADQASDTLDDLPGHGDASESKVRELLEGVRGDMAQLSELRGRLLADVDKSREAVDQQFQDLAERVQRLQEELAQGLRNAEESVEKLRRAVNDARARLAEQQPLLLEAIQSLPMLAGNEATTLAGYLHALLVLLGRSLFETCQRILHCHNEALKPLRAGFTGESPAAAAAAVPETWVKQSVQPLQDALDELALLPGPAGESLDDLASAITEMAYAGVMSAGEIGIALQKAVPDTPTTRGA